MAFQLASKSSWCAAGAAGAAGQAATHQARRPAAAGKARRPAGRHDNKFTDAQMLWPRCPNVATGRSRSVANWQRSTRGKAGTMGLLILLLIIFLLFGGGGYYGYRSGYYGGAHFGGGLTLVLVIIVLFLLFGGGSYYHY